MTEHPETTLTATPMPSQANGWSVHLPILAYLGETYDDDSRPIFMFQVWGPDPDRDRSGWAAAWFRTDNHFAGDYHVAQTFGGAVSAWRSFAPFDGQGGRVDRLAEITGHTLSEVLSAFRSVPGFPTLAAP